MQRAGWRHVKPDGLNGYFSDECKGQDYITYGDLALMERPQAMTDEARDADLDMAYKRYASSLEASVDNNLQLPEGMIPHVREIQRSKEPAPNYMKPSYKTRATAPAGDGE
jgi:hypothetical protein